MELIGDGRIGQFTPIHIRECRVEARDIELSTIRVSSVNTRKDLDAGTEDTGIMDLANSIREQGLLSPIIVRAAPDGGYELIAGQRRFLACRLLGRATISAIVRDDLDDTDATVVSLVENVHRADMNAIDKATAYRGIYAKYGSEKRVAKETGVTLPTVRRYMALLNLAPSIQDEMTTSEGPAGVGTLSQLADTFPPEQQVEVLRQIGGFTQSIQQEILKRSGGDQSKVPDLVDQAMDGAFDTHTCREGLCFLMPEELKAEVKIWLDEDTSSNGVAVN